MFRKLISAMVSLVLCAFAVGVPAFADSPIIPADPVVFNGLELSMTACVIEGRVYLPVRTLAEAMGYTVEWSNTGGDDIVKINNDVKGFTDSITLDITGRSVDDNGHVYSLIGTDNTDGCTIQNDHLYMSASEFAELFPVSVSYADGKYIVNTVAENGIKISCASEPNSSEHLDANIQYPQISGLDNADIQEAINNTFSSAAQSALAEGIENESRQAEIREEKADLPNTVTDFNYHVKYNQNGIVSIVLDDYQYVGGAVHGTTVQSAKTFDLSTGKELCLNDLMSDAEGARKYISSYISSSIPAGSATIPITSIGDSPDYYLSNNGLTVYFQEYEHFAFSYGIVGFTVPYSNLKAYIKPDYGFLYPLPIILDSKNTNVLTVGQTGSAVLQANATTGYSWHCSVSDTTVIAVDSEYYIPDASGQYMVGTGGNSIFIIKALRKGSAAVTFRYYRSWESASATADTVTYNITVG